ncbi:MAG: hypothetical protein HC869_26565 [Rhodospirillales bacterium]|nr:hypothetical protein [Rhodospirillales bacterium]
MTAERDDLVAQRDALVADRNNLVAQRAAHAADYAKLEAKLAHVTADHRDAVAQLDHVIGSTTWKLTGPVRNLVEHMRSQRPTKRVG